MAPMNLQCKTEEPEKEVVAPLAQPEIQKDSDSDFCEVKPLDDVDISDQLIMKNEVSNILQLPFGNQFEFDLRLKVK